MMTTFPDTERRSDEKMERTMEEAALTLILILILGPGLTPACRLQSVTQNPLLAVTLYGDVVKVLCDIRVTSGSGDMVTSLYQAGHPSTLLNSRTASPENTTVTHKVTVTESAVYYCRVTCGASNMDGRGTYIHVRGRGYVAPSRSSYILCSWLIALSVLLLIPAVSGSYLVLPFIWKSEAQSPAQSPAVTESGRVRPVVEDAGSSLYTSLEPRMEEVYDILEDETKTKDPGGPKKHQVEIHDVAPGSPVRKVKLQAKVSSLTEKPPITPKPNVKVSDINVYENIRRGRAPP